MGLTGSEKYSLYSNLSAILHLTNVKFESNNIPETQVTELTKKHFIIAAKLMNVTDEELEKAILFRSFEVRGQGSPMWIHLSMFKASRARDTIAKKLYMHIFQSIVDYINRALSNKTGQTTNINIIDIAGFGKHQIILSDQKIEINVFFSYRMLHVIKQSFRAVLHKLLERKTSTIFHAEADF